MTDESKQSRQIEVESSGDIGRVSVIESITVPATAVPATGEPISVFTRVEFEDALDNVSEPATKPDTPS